jgi:hypothetical protein
MLLTVVWATLLSTAANPGETVRCAFVVAGIVAAASFFVIDIDTQHVSVVPGLVLVVYQACLSLAFAAHPVSTQAIVNCNTVMLVLYSWHTGRAPFDWTVAAASALVAAATAYIAFTLGDV